MVTRQLLLLLQSSITLLLLICQHQWPLSHGFAIPSSTLPLSSSAASSAWRSLTPIKASCITRQRHRHRMHLHVNKDDDNSDNANNNDEPNAESSIPSSSPTKKKLRVGIIGAGSIAFGTASLAASLGHDPMIWSPSGEGTNQFQLDNDDDNDDDDTTVTFEIQSTGALDHNFNVRIARSPKDLVRSNDNVLVVALPVNGHKNVMEGLAPEIMELIMEQKQQHQEEEQLQQQNQQLQQEEQPNYKRKDQMLPTTMMHIIISSHSSLGAVYFMQLLREERRRYCLKRRTTAKTTARRRKSQSSPEIKADEEGSVNHSSMNCTIDDNDDDDDDDDDDIGVRITAWGTTVITARKTSGTSVNVLTVRRLVDYCTVPSVIPPDIGSVQADRSKEKLLQQPTALMSSSRRRQKDLSLFDADIDDGGYHLCTTLFGPRFKHRKGGLLAISLSNLNPQNHLGIVLGNMSRMDPPPPPPPPPPPQFAGTESTTTQSNEATERRTSIEPWYQGKNVTPNIGRLMEALDRERLDIAKALDIEVRTIYEHFSWSFHVPLETTAPVVVVDDGDAESLATATTMASTKKQITRRPLTVSEMNQQMHHYLHNDVLGPSSPDSRYVLEDVPYGLVLTVILGRLVDMPAILHESGIRILSAMYGRDFMVENELLQGLGLLIDDDNAIDGDYDGVPSLEMWREMAYSGYFRDVGDQK